MQTILVTGSAGFIGKHLVEALRRRHDTNVIPFDLDTSPESLDRGLYEADVIYHLAGVNRPHKVEEFKTGNADFTEFICARLLEIRGKGGSLISGLRPLALFVLSSSLQAELDNPYGISKRQAERAVEEYARRAAEIPAPRSPPPSPFSLLPAPRSIIFRLKNVFGKWCRPNYNSVTATFCHNIAHDLPITISDPDRELELVYIDDVIAAFLSVLDVPEVRGQRSEASNTEYREVPRSFKVTLGELAAKIRSFRDSRTTLVMPSFDDALTRCLYATYLSYLGGREFAYPLFQRHDNRGVLAEFVKSPTLGQIFVSRTRPGITRGNHYHHTKTEKFFVVEGDAIIRFRKIVSDPKTEDSSKPPTSDLCPLSSVLCSSEVIEHRVSGKDFKVLDIPPGYTHSIENVGQTELVTLFWASEIFDQEKPDTYPMAVK
jgi:UDP-2-acetamido-2,6-beta-L-arabino-hexul-4-ose reductase